MSGAILKPHLFTTPQSAPPNESVRRCFFLPQESEWLGLFGGAISALFDPENWQERSGGVSIEDTIQVFLEAWVGKVDNFMIGSIVPVMLATVPEYMLLCDGTNYDGEDYPELYAVIGDEWKLGDGTFVVPAMKGRFIIGAMEEEDGEGHIFPVDVTGGSYEHTLSESEMPEHDHTSPSHSHTSPPHTHVQNSHNHTQDAHGHSVNSVPSSTPGTNAALMRGSAALGNTAVNNTTATNQAATATNQDTTVTVNGASVTIDASGGGEAHNNIPPYRAFRLAVIAR